jgi:hypothetical protein
MASPATLPFAFAMDADWIRANGVYYDTNYNRLVIPSTSYITMGGVVYSMYHDIEILINRNTGAITAYYDGSSTNTLNQLASNMLIDVQEFARDGLNWFQIEFNMYQFERQILSYTVAREQGFDKTISFEDQFYAAKVFNKAPGGEWTELAYSLSKQFYDPKKPTAVIQLLTDTSEIKIKIPQVYFDNNQISQNIRVELYTTKGKVNYSISAADVNDRQANFDTSSSSFAAPFEQMPTWRIFPTAIEVAGGSDVSPYEEVRDAIVNQQLSDRVAVTQNEITKKGKHNGFDLTRLKDDLTERIYLASNVLVDSTNMIIPTFTGGILIKDEALEGNPSTIINHTDGYYTILPTTTFKIADNGNTCIPMTDGDVTAMAGMTKQQLVNELNSGNYVRQPFHVTLQTNPKSPQTLIYNLLDPQMKSLAFIAENPNSAPQMSVTACNVTHLDNGTGGYRVTLGITRSSNIESEDVSNFRVIFSCPNKGGEYVYLPATYVSTTPEGLDVWEVMLRTNYHLTSDDYLTVEMFDSNDLLSGVEVSINQTFSITTAFVGSFEPTIPIDVSLNSFIPDSVRDQLVAMARQTMKLQLGQNLSSQIFCAVNTSWGNDVYKTADETVYYKNSHPIYQTTPDTGVVNTRTNAAGTKPEVVLIYPIDSTPSDLADLVIGVTEDVLPSAGSTTTYKIASTKGLLVGMKARGTNVPAGSVIFSVGPNTVTLNKKITKVVTKGTAITFTNPSPVLSVSTAQSTAGTQVKVASTADLLIGQSVYGFDIPTGAKVKTIDSGTQFTLTVATTKALAKDTLITVINTTAPGVVKIAPGDIVTDASGKAIVVKSAQNQYLIPSILFDGRLFASEDPIDQEIITTIAGRLNNFANQVSTIDAGLIEDADVYYKPARSMGSADFGVGGKEIRNMSLGLGFSVLIYVDAAVYNTQTLLNTMEATVRDIINAEIQKPTISVSAITETIRSRLGTNAAAVEMGPISGVDGLRLISINQANITPSIENKLIVESDGNIKRVPNITVTYLPKPDTAEMVAKTTL